jgi:hypothetical protein
MFKKPGALLIRLALMLHTFNVCLSLYDDLQNENLKFLNNDVSHKDPRHVSEETTHHLALEQTIYARNLLYYPNDSLTYFLEDAAEALFNFASGLELSLVRALGARILNKEGLLSNQSEAELLGALERLAFFKTTTSDRLVCIALLGDIGALFADTGATTGIYGRTPAQAEILRLKFKTFSKRLNKGVDYFTDAIINRIKSKRGSHAVGPDKSKERKRLGEETRSGIFNYGEKADEILRIDIDDRMPKTTWSVGTIEEVRLNVLEPWAGHMSGSPSEILHVWDAVTGEDPLKSFVDNISYETIKLLKSPQRAAKAAGASAFLVALGYHSAMECIEGTFAYLGQDFRLAGMISDRQDAGHFLQSGASTSMMSGLFREVTRIDNIFIFSEDYDDF